MKVSILISAFMAIAAGFLQCAFAVTFDEMKAHVTSTLSSSYLTYVRPVINQSDVVDVRADLFLIGINGFDNVEQKLTTTAYLEIRWTDEILAKNWNISSIDALYVPQTNLWIPDLALQNGFNTLKGLGDSFLYLKVDKTGEVTWRPYQVLETACDVDVTFFPFDKSTCDLKFVIWSHSSNTVTVRLGSIGLNTDLYEANSEWDLLSATSSEFMTSRSTGVTYTIVIERKPLQYLINVIVPAILLGVLNTFVFILPATAGEKTGFAVTAFLSFAVFLSIISSELPENSRVLSVVSAYIFIMTIVSTFMVVVTITQLRIFNRPEKRPVSRFWERISRCVRRMQCAVCVGERKMDDEEKPSAKEEEITWQGVASCIDFIGFWSFLIFMLLFTIIIVIVAVVGGSTS